MDTTELYNIKIAIAEMKSKNTSEELTKAIDNTVDALSDLINFIDNTELNPENEFVCASCGTIYNTEAEAEKCYNKH
jgi:hypothetical protein